MDPTRLRLVLELRQRIKDGTAKELRRAAGLSLADVGAHLGRDSTSVMRWERGEVFPRGDAAVKWAELLRDIESEIARSTATAA